MRLLLMVPLLVFTSSSLFFFLFCFVGFCNEWCRYFWCDFRSLFLGGLSAYVSFVRLLGPAFQFLTFLAPFPLYQSGKHGHPNNQALPVSDVQ
jgi:hypothetical protein